MLCLASNHLNPYLMPSYSFEHVQAMVAAFERQEISAEDWTHEAHLLVAAWYAYHESVEEAILRMKSGIILLNHSHGNRNTLERGYHETLTIFWVLYLVKILKEITTQYPLDHLFNALLAHPEVHSQAPLAYYTQDQLFSQHARVRWVEPNVKALA